MLILLSLLLAAVPPAYAWWTGRAVRRAIDDPTLPERLLERQKRIMQVTLVVIIAGALVSAFPGFTVLVILAVLVAQYPTRRAVYGDTWSLWQYVRFTSFSGIAFLGLWLFPLIASGVVVRVARTWIPGPSRDQTLLGLALATTAAVVYVVWSRNFVRAWLALHQASPIDASGPRASLLARFDAVLERSGARLPGRPSIHRYGAEGGQVVNAAALCSLHGRAVAMSDTLLAHLDDDEATAIFAHEIAHHEHYTDALLRKRRLASWLLAVLMVAIPTLQLAVGSRWDIAIDVLFLVVILVLLARGQAGHQKHETASDLRAVELTGDADAVIRGLTKIHALGRMPRRFSQEFERAASHPSLARRIQAIRAHAPAADAPLPAPTVIASRTAGSWVALDDRRVHWFEGVPAGTDADLVALRESAASQRALAYAELGELRLETDTPRALRATDLAGASWTVPLRDEDVARVQAALDRVDAKLGTIPIEAPATSTNTARTIASLLLLATMFAGMWGMPMLLALVAMAAPTAASMATLALVAAGRALLAAGSENAGAPYETIALAATVAAALWAAFIAWRWTRRPRTDVSARATRWRRTLHALLVLGVAVAIASLFDDLADSPAALLGNPDVASGAMTLAGLGLFLRYLPARAARAGSIGALAVAAVGILVGTVGDRFGPSSALAWTTGRLVPVTSRPIAVDVYGVELSPAGTRFLTRGQVGDEHSGYSTQQLLVGDVGSSAAPRSLVGLDAVLPNERDVLVLRHLDDDSLALSLETLDADSASRVVWRRTLPPLADPQLRVDAPGARWLVSGRGFESARHWVTTIAGAMDGGDARTVQLPADSLFPQVLHAFDDGTALVAVVTRPIGAGIAPGPTIAAFLAVLRGGMSRWAITRVDARGRRTLARMRGFPSCVGASRDSAVCIDQWPRAAHVWRIARDGAVDDLGALPRRYDHAMVSSNGRVVASQYTGSSLAIIDPVGRRAVRTSLPDVGGQYVREAGATDSGVVAVVANGQQTRIVVYRLIESR